MVKKQRMQNVAWLAKTLCFVAAIFLVCSRCPAQIASAELSGNVLDSSGAAIPNATVTAINVATTIAAQDHQREGRRLCAHRSSPGDYTLTVEAPGFRKLEQTGISLQVNQQARIDPCSRWGRRPKRSA